MISYNSRNFFSVKKLDELKMRFFYENVIPYDLCIINYESRNRLLFRVKLSEKFVDSMTSINIIG